MTSQPGPAPNAAPPASQITKPLRELAAAVLVGANALLLFVGLINVLIPHSGDDTVTHRAAGGFFDFAGLPGILFPLLAVLLATHVQPPVGRAKLITQAAVVEYAVSAVLAVVCFFLWLIGSLADGAFRDAFTGLLTRLAYLAVFAVAAFMVHRVWRTHYHTPRPRREPGVYGQPQPNPYGQQGYPQQGYQPGWPQPGQSPAGYQGQPQQYGQPAFGPGVAQQPGYPAYGQPGYPPAGAPASAPPASAPPAPSPASAPPAAPSAAASVSPASAPPAPASAPPAPVSAPPAPVSAPPPPASTATASEVAGDPPAALAPSGRAVPPAGEPSGEDRERDVPARSAEEPVPAHEVDTTAVFPAGSGETAGADHADEVPAREAGADGRAVIPAQTRDTGADRIEVNPAQAAETGADRTEVIPRQDTSGSEATQMIIPANRPSTRPGPPPADGDPGQR